MAKVIKYFREVPNLLLRSVIAFLRNNDSILASVLRRKFYRTPCSIDTSVFITNPANFATGNGCALYHACYILNTYGKFHMGCNSHLGAFCYVNVCYGSIDIGDNVAIGPGCKIIAYSNHYGKGRLVTETKTVGDIFIGNNVFIGANSVILPGTIIEDNVVVGAGAVIKGKLESNSIYGGVPCRKITTGWQSQDTPSRGG